MTGGIVVWSDQPELRNELVSEARRVADAMGGGAPVMSFCAVDDDDAAALAAVGVDIAYSPGPVAGDSGSYVGLLAGVIDRADPHLVVIGASKSGMDVAARLAERTSANYGPWAVSYSVDTATGETTATCMIYAGVGLATYQFKPGMTILTCAPGVFEVTEQSGRTARREQVDVISVPDSRISVVRTEPKDVNSERLGDAKAVVDIGQGVKDIEQLERVRAFAERIDASLACSRPISSTRGWFPEWLGLSGVKIHPELCVTLGISGAIQHMIGVRDSRVIVSVNSDENAAIFLQSDAGVVADLDAFLPVLEERMQARRIRVSWD